MRSESFPNKIAFSTDLMDYNPRVNFFCIVEPDNYTDDIDSKYSIKSVFTGLKKKLEINQIVIFKSSSTGKEIRFVRYDKIGDFVHCVEVHPLDKEPNTNLETLSGRIIFRSYDP